ncbi:hypothetical protein POSPLADRAFT_1036855 [Postia placenta MAD-698-R-SB12]|uniref:DUF6533 domain-containing protein n=1 Tax=Postia placenta MAD-698-R-SB12 TaxID=670580 RepID=A0A1X6MMF5_9APHY|nr:hypothetical protein POSPLADRAFT_1036855 [Postia placenta MAD-698-R-SB12]OSX57352.1 hypothetical protein POSPLADRAFT_1036855 [Postia placenta MAD-698-R-SB12]
MYGSGDGLMASDGAVWLLYIFKLPLDHAPSRATSSIRLKMSRIAAALIVYEHILTSGDEIRLKWGYRRLIVAICFYLNRLTLLALGITGLLLVLPWKHKMLCIIAITAAVSAFRTYLAGNRSWCLAGVALAFGLVPVGTNLVNTTTSDLTLSLLILTDYSTDSPEYPSNSQSTMGSRTVKATSSCLPQRKTGSRHVLEVRFADSVLGFLANQMHSYYCNTSMCDSVRCDGNPGDMEQHVQYRSLYFIALLLLNVIDMVTYYLNHLIGNLTAFILPLSSVLISRLLFNLRDATHRYEEGNTPSLACTISDTAYPSFDAERQAWHIKIEDAEQRYDSDDELFDDDEFMDDDATLCDTTRQRVCDPLNTV